MFRPALLTALVTVLALPAPSLAKDPLLSGYAAPGGGEQVLLGSRPIGGGPGGSGGSGGGSAAVTPSGDTATATQGSLRAPASAAQANGDTSSSAAPATPKPKSAKSGSKSESATPAPATALPRRVAYPTRADDAGGFPLSAGELAVGGLALLVLAGMGAWLRRAAANGGGPGAQASA